MADLTDTEIRSFLKKHGEDIGPITASTRSVYIKKINSIQKLNKNSTQTNKSLESKEKFSLSSDKLNSNRSNSKSINNDDDGKIGSFNVKNFSTPKITNYSGTIPSQNKKPTGKLFADLKSESSFNRDELYSNSRHFKQDSFESDLSMWAEENRRRQLIEKNISPINFPLAYNYNQPRIMKYNTTRPLLTNNNQFSLCSVSSSSGGDVSRSVDYLDRSIPVPVEKFDLKSRIKQWYTGSIGAVSQYFTGRQTNHSNGYHHGSGVDNDLMMDISDGDLSETDDTNLISRLKKNYTKKRTSQEKMYSLKTKSEKKAHYLSNINVNQLPNFLLVAFICFAVVLFSSYLFRKSQFSYTELDIIMEGLVCKESSDQMTAPMGMQSLKRSCFSSSEMVKLRSYLAMLYRVLNEYSGDKMCQFINDKRLSFSKAREFLNYRLKREQRRTEDLSDNDWSRLMQLLISLPHDQLNIMAYTKDGRPIEHDELPEHVTYLQGMAPKRSIMCQLRMAFVSMLQFVSYVVGVLAALAVMLLAGYCLNLYRLKKKEIYEIHLRELREIVSSISLLLQDQLRQSDYSPSSDPFLSVIKIRSIMQSTYPKVKDNKFWEQVKQFMYKSEPLIELKESIVHGESLQWKCRSGWQGSAVQSECQVKFEKGPTECLKIRNMELNQFDEVGQNYLRREILNRIKGAGEVRDVRFLVKGLKVIVYVMCSSREVAGKAFRKINANYFNGNLINVKFIRLDKYLERFPDSKVYVK